MLEVFNMPQGTEDWLSVRSGIITASAMSNVLAKGAGKTRKTYMYKLIGERFTGEPSDGFSNAHTDRGHLLEPEARELYSDMSGNEVSEIGFMKNFNVGYSPDGVIGEAGLLEIKTRLPHLMAETLDTQKVPSSHKAQIQSGLWVSEREWLDFVAYWPGMPIFMQRVYRDDGYISEMISSVDAFYSEMEEIINKISNEQ